MDPEPFHHAMEHPIEVLRGKEAQFNIIMFFMFSPNLILSGEVTPKRL